ncbi:hypothetical protein [Herminiimonas sp. CN]|uniref:hypothetical protein n=1 Tax=Herminiimonas sp. CN TaxID=1349818 RepID=UPI000A9FF586|nr:hypothetical protein [Herminiimonas sp. CN]
MLPLAELRQNNRLRIGLALIVGIIWLYWLMDLRDQHTQLLDQYKQAGTQVARLQAQQKQTQWLDRAEQAQFALDAAQARIWHSSSLGLAQAELQDWLNAQLQELKAVRPTVKVGDSENSAKAGDAADKADDMQQLSHLRAQVSLNFDPKTLHGLLIAMAGAENQIVVDSMIVRATRVDLTLSAWYKIAPAQTEEQPKATANTMNKS